MKIISHQNISELPCERTAMVNFAVSMLGQPVSQFVANSEGEFFLAANSTGAIPFFVSSPRSSQNYASSLESHYVYYPKRELELLNLSWLFPVLAPILLFLKLLLRFCRSEEVVYIGNWLVSTNLHDQWLTDHIEEIVLLVREHYPDRATVIRSINLNHHQDLYKRALSHGAVSVFSRRVYQFDPRFVVRRMSSDLKKDLKLLSRSSLSVIKLGFNDRDSISAVAGMYRKQYIEKYSELNPQLTERFITEAIRSGFYEVYLLRDGNGPVAALGFYEVENLITAPILGIDYSHPKHKTAYRALTAFLSRVSLDRNIELNRSAGADQFKINRGSVPVEEMSLIWSSNHLFKWFAGSVNFVARCL